MEGNNSFFTKLTKTVFIDEENKIFVKAPTYGEVQKANSKAMSVKVGMNGEGEVLLDSSLLESLMMHVCISGWEGPGFEGKSCNEANIDALPSWVISLIRPVVNELTKGLEPNEKKV